MECGHAIYDLCVCIFGTLTKGLEYHYDLRSCPICLARVTFQARLLPPTCRIRFVSFDGGGSKAVVSIGFMQKLQQTLNLEYPVQEHFDFSIGTSSGGVVNLGLFAKYWTPDQCLVFFFKFAWRIFASKKGVRRSICSRITRVFAYFFADERYEAAILEKFLKEALGTSPMFDSIESRPSGMKYAVTATTISDATLCLISNYLVDGKQNDGSGRSTTSVVACTNDS